MNFFIQLSIQRAGPLLPWVVGEEGQGLREIEGGQQEEEGPVDEWWPIVACSSHCTGVIVLGMFYFEASWIFCC